jgi:F-type H+-transporting ATPase subunit a
MLLSIFFFVLGLNLFGQIPFLGGSNVTGNLSFTMVLALITFFVVNFNGNKHYWEHIFWMPGIPAWVKIILTPVEILGVLIKPLTLMLRLFANITAGHIAILIFISLIFILLRKSITIEKQKAESRKQKVESGKWKVERLDHKVDQFKLKSFYSL